MNFFDNSDNEPNSMCFLATNEFLILCLYTFTSDYLLDMLWH